jgi:hypothetical protein
VAPAPVALYRHLGEIIYDKGRVEVALKSPFIPLFVQFCSKGEAKLLPLL